MLLSGSTIAMLQLAFGSLCIHKLNGPFHFNPVDQQALASC